MDEQKMKQIITKRCELIVHRERNLYYFRKRLECWWNGGGYKIGTRQDCIIRKIKSYFFRVVIVAVACAMIAEIVWLGAEVFREVVAWGELHLETLGR